MRTIDYLVSVLLCPLSTLARVAWRRRRAWGRKWRAHLVLQCVCVWVEWVSGQPGNVHPTSEYEWKKKLGEKMRVVPSSLFPFVVKSMLLFSCFVCFYFQWWCDLLFVSTIQFLVSFQDCHCPKRRHGKNIEICKFTQNVPNFLYTGEKCTHTHTHTMVSIVLIGVCHMSLQGVRF